MSERPSAAPPGRAWVSALLSCLLMSCSGVLSRPEAPPPDGAARCRVGASQTSVLVTEWPASEKGNLEALLRGTAVAVEFSGCSLRLVPECRLGGRYAWLRTTPSTDSLEIRNEADLYTKLPLGALSLAGELQRSGTLIVETTVSGQLRLQEARASDVPSTHECSRATHVIEGLSLGAFATLATESFSGRGTVSGYGMEGGGRGARSARMLSQAGNRAACSAATEDGIPADCASPIQVFLAPIPGRAEAPGPPGSVKVDFVSGDPKVRWDVYVDDEATCTTPCALWVDPNRPISMRTRDDHPATLQVERLDSTRGPLSVAAYPASMAKLATGITFTSLGGMGLLTGVTLTAFGCSSDRGGMCLAGLITAPTAGLITAGSILLILDSSAEVKVSPLFGGSSLDARLGPGYLRGTF